MTVLQGGAGHGNRAPCHSARDLHLDDLRPAVTPLETQSFTQLRVRRPVVTWPQHPRHPERVGGAVNHPGGVSLIPAPRTLEMLANTFLKQTHFLFVSGATSPDL